MCRRILPIFVARAGLVEMLPIAVAIVTLPVKIRGALVLEKLRSVQIVYD